MLRGDTGAGAPLLHVPGCCCNARNRRRPLSPITAPRGHTRTHTPCSRPQPDGCCKADAGQRAHPARRRLTHERAEPRALAHSRCGVHGRMHGCEQRWLLSRAPRPLWGRRGHGGAVRARVGVSWGGAAACGSHPGACRHVGIDGDVNGGGCGTAYGFLVKAPAERIGRCSVWRGAEVCTAVGCTGGTRGS